VWRLGKGLNTVRTTLQGASRDAFDLGVSGILADLLPRFIRSRRLGTLDCQGIDCHQLDEATEATTLAVQCKGFELPFGDDQLAQCLEDIAKFGTKGPIVAEYWLIANRRANDDQRAAIEVALDGLRAKGKAASTRFLDLEGFIRHTQELAEQKIAGWALARQAELEADFKARLAVVSYIDGAPFAAAEAGHDPAQWIVAKIDSYLGRIHDAHIGKDRAPPRYLLTASFGFGKTSTLHAVSGLWTSAGGHVLYVPAALLAASAFPNAAILTENFLELIRPMHEDPDPLAALLLREAFKRELARTKKWILLIDAIDESPNWARHSSLASLWGCINDLGLPTVVTVREELLALRPDEFLGDGGIPGRGPFFKLISLEDWPELLIGRFLDRFAGDRPGEASAAFTQFREAVAACRYEALYGDIPKRPLFLGMLAEDAWAGLAPETHLHRLYGVYFRRKLLHDRYGAQSRPVREGAIAEQFGLDEIIHRMMAAMQAVAIRMGRPDGAGSLINERDLQAIVLETVGTYGQVEEVALNSLMQPAGRDLLTGARVFRFAHQSFQDWFTARWLANGGDPAELAEVSPGVAAFAAAMALDVAEGRGFS